MIINLYCHGLLDVVTCNLPSIYSAAAMKTSRLIFLLIFIACTGLLGFGLYLEHVQGLEPCPLCVLQRIAYVVIAIVALAGAIHGTENLMKYIYAGLIIVASLAGAGIAGRQVWLQHLPPDQVPECGPGYEYLMDVFPLDEALGMIFTGSGECAANFSEAHTNEQTQLLMPEYLGRGTIIEKLECGFDTRFNSMGVIVKIG